MYLSFLVPVATKQKINGHFFHSEKALLLSVACFSPYYEKVASEEGIKKASIIPIAFQMHLCALGWPNQMAKQVVRVNNITCISNFSVDTGTFKCGENRNVKY